MKVHVERDRCIGAGLCVMSAPTVFDQRDEDGLVVLLNDSPSEDEADNLRKVAQHICPSKAILITED